MFGFARIIVRNKIVFLGLAIVLAFLFHSSKDPASEKPANPWSSAPAAPVVPVASSDGMKTSLTDKVLKAADSAADYAGVGEYKPSALRDKAVGSMDEAAGSMKKVNRSE